MDNCNWDLTEGQKEDALLDQRKAYAKLEAENKELRQQLAEKKCEKCEQNRQHRRHFEKLYDDSEGKNFELQAQLARCSTLVESLQDFAIWMTGCGYEFGELDYFKTNQHLLTDSLPDSAKLDAEILRCAKRWVKEYKGNNASLALVKAVRAREEME